MAREQRREQVPTFPLTMKEVMRNREFGIGVAEVRSGQPPRFDEMDSWFYERGRQWAMLAPANLNPHGRKAFRLMDAAFRRKFII